MATTRSPTIQPPLRQGYSPVFSQYNRWSSVYGTALPRTYDTYRSGDFSPFEPILPNPIDIPEEPSGRPRPRRFQYPVGWNLPIGQPGTEGVTLATFQMMRDMAEVGSIPRRAIEICKSDVLVLGQEQHSNFGGWDIVPTKKAGMAMQGQPKKRKDWEERKEEALGFFANPDPDNYLGFVDWANALLEDSLVLDAISIYISPARGGRKAGPFKSSIGALELIDSASIRPLLGTHGGRPRPPQPAFQQSYFGVPRVDLMDLINLGPDATIDDIKDLNPVLEELTEVVDEWSGDQLLYYIRNRRSFTPYGFSPLAQCLLPVAIMQARQTWQWQFFRSGSLPAVFMDPGEMIGNADEARELQEAINMLGGNLAADHQVIVTPPGAKITQQKDTDLTSDFDTLAISEIISQFGLQLTDYGIAHKTGTLNSGMAAAAQETGVDRTTRRSVLPNAAVLKFILDKFTQVKFGQKDMEWSSGVSEEGKNEKEVDDRWLGRLSASACSIDEARVPLGLEPFGEVWSQIPLAFLGTGPVALSAAVEASLTPPDPLELAAAGASQVVAGPGGGPKKPPAGGSKPAALGPGPNGSAKKPAGTDKPATDANAAARATESQPKPKPSSGGTKPAARQRQAAKSYQPTPFEQSELEVLERYLTKGRPLESFVPKALTPSALAAGRGSADPKSAVAAIRRAHQRAQRRDSALAPLRKAVAVGLGAHVNKLRQRRMTVPEFVDASQDTMTEQMTEAALLGADHAADDYSYQPSPDTQVVAEQRASRQSAYLTALAMAILGGSSVSMMARRAELYGESLTGAYEEGYGNTAASAFGSEGEEATITWYAVGDKDVCQACKDLDGKTFTRATLPGFPGESGFGDVGPTCQAGPRCRCHIEYSYSPAAPLVENQADQQDAGWGKALQAARDNAALRKSVREQIAVAQGIPPAEVNATLVAHMAKGKTKAHLPTALSQEVEDRLSKTYPRKSLAWVHKMAWTRENGVPLDGISVTGPSSKADLKDILQKADKMRSGKPIKPVVLVNPGQDGLLEVADGHHRVSAALEAKIPKVPAFVGRPAIRSDAWRDEIMDMQMVRATKDFSLSGPSGVAMVPYDLEPGAQRIYPDPINDSIIESTPSYPQGSVVAAGLFVVAADTGRVLMLQRALDKTAAAGKLEAAGGKLEPGEEPLEAALREWSEEVHQEVPEGQIVGTWISPNGIYQGFALLIASEDLVHINADPENQTKQNPDDPEGREVEPVLWFAVDDLVDNPAVRLECLESTNWDLLRAAPLDHSIPETKAYEPPTEEQLPAWPDATNLPVGHTDPVLRPGDVNTYPWGAPLPREAEPFTGEHAPPMEPTQRT